MNYVKGKITGTQCIDYSHQTEMRVSKSCFPAHSERTFVFCLQLSKPVKEAGLMQNRGFMPKRLLIVCVCAGSLCGGQRTAVGVGTCHLSCLRQGLLFMLCLLGQRSHQSWGTLSPYSCRRSAGILDALHTQPSPSPEQLLKLICQQDTEGKNKDLRHVKT